MKKTIFIFTITLLSCFSHYSHAQTEKGKRLIGATTSLNAGIIEHSRVRDNVSTLSERITRFSLTPHAGYFIKDNLALGAQLSVSFSNTKDYDYDSELRETNLAFSPFIRYYFGTKKVRPLVHVSGGIGSYKDKYIASSSPNYNRESTSTLFCYSIGVGAGVFLNDMVSIDLELGYGGISSKINEDLRGRQNAFGFNAGFSFFF